MRKLIRRIWRWVFVKRYYVVRMFLDYGPASAVAMSHAHHFGGCPNTGVFDDYNNAMRYWHSRVTDNHDPGFTYEIKDVTHWLNLLEEYFHFNPEKRPCP